ncbi:hypothetical protein H5410_028308 [Solanum commersonii]|uniref:Uncharacterized protein n=1 Tax=Solanum commersonii TaxID=4109 RepID=A0A9J5Z4F5_SOLCO|nr:hypothetical protein H5410_028308 [Solanum commersonii]
MRHPSNKQTYLLNFSATVGQFSCPSCFKSITVDFTTNDQKAKETMKGFRSSSILNRICLDNFLTSIKIEALREEITFMIERDGSIKAIVFSQFTSFLDPIHYSLQKVRHVFFIPFISTPIVSINSQQKTFVVCIWQSGISCVQLDGSMTIIARDFVIIKIYQ